MISHIYNNTIIISEEKYCKKCIQIKNVWCMKVVGSSGVTTVAAGRRSVLMLVLKVASQFVLLVMPDCHRNWLCVSVCYHIFCDIHPWYDNDGGISFVGCVCSKLIGMIYHESFIMTSLLIVT